MTIFLRQSTASQEIPLGYFVDSTDGNTEETGLTIANTDIKIWKTGATTLANKNSGGGTHISNGIYYAVLDATDTDTIGPLRVFVHVSGALAVKVDCVVLDEAVYDVLFGTVALATLSNITSAAGIAVASIGAGAITAAAIATGAIDADALAADAVAEIADGVWDEDATGHQTGGTFGQAIGDPGADATTIYQSVVTDAAGTNIAADIIAIEAQTDDIGAAGAGLTAVPWNAAWDAEVQSEVDDGLVARGLDHLLAAAVAGADITDNSIIAKLVSKSATADWDSFDNTTDSHEAIRDNMGTAQTGDSFARLGAPAGASVSADIAAIEGQTDDIGAAGAGLTAVPWNAAWDAEVQSEVQDALDAVLADSVPADGSRPSLAQAAYMIVQFLTERAVSGTTVTVKKVDGTTSLMTFTINDASTPTSITRS